MDAFSYLSVLLSVILGLAVQQVLQGYRALALNRRTVKLYWPSLAWSGIILAMVAQHWWASFSLAERAQWSFAAFAAILIQTALIYMMAALVLPDVPVDQPIDLKQHFFREQRVFFAVGAATVAWSVIREVALEGRLPLPENLAFHAIFIAMALGAMVSRSERLQKMFVTAVAVIFVAYIGLLFAQLR
jgi:hypothetical protein